MKSLAQGHPFIVESSEKTMVLKGLVRRNFWIDAAKTSREITVASEGLVASGMVAFSLVSDGHHYGAYNYLYRDPNPGNDTKYLVITAGIEYSRGYSRSDLLDLLGQPFHVTRGGDGQNFEGLLLAYIYDGYKYCLTTANLDCGDPITVTIEKL